MKLSHSKLAKIMSCPMSYRLTYELGIWTKVEKPALSIGSAVHWGIEHNTCDLSSYFKEQGTFKQGDTYTREQLLSEAMVYGYLKHKDEIFEQILVDPDNPDEKLVLEDETHELYVTGKLKSFLQNQDHHDFVGIVDLLLLTNKGFVVIDYKTSTYEPDWDGYLDQIYRYIFMLQSEFPDVPVVKVGIINIKKTAIRQKKMENESEFFNRMKFEYEINTENYVNYHEFPKKDIDERLLNSYIENLSVMADAAQTIVDNKLFFINFSNAKTSYGKSDFYDIFYHTPNAYVLYAITDFVWDEDEKLFSDKRDCIELDMRCADTDYAKVLNKYSLFEPLYIEYFKDKIADETTLMQFVEYLRSQYYIDDDLILLYLKTLNMKQKVVKAFGCVNINEKYDNLLYSFNQEKEVENDGTETETEASAGE